MTATGVVYLLLSEDKQHTYIGSTKNFPRRLAEHNAGRSKSTKPYKPWTVLEKRDVPYPYLRKLEISAKKYRSGKLFAGICDDLENKYPTLAPKIITRYANYLIALDPPDCDSSSS